jgi:hypothetical protein
MRAPTPALEKAETANAAREQLRALAGKGGVVVRGALLAIDDPCNDVGAVLLRRSAAVRVAWSTSAAQYLRLEGARTSGSEEKVLSGNVLVMPTGRDGVHAAFTADSSEFVRDLLIPLLDHCNPRLFLPSVTSKSLAKVVLSASKQAGVRDFEVTDLGVRSQTENKRGRRLRSERIWTEEPVETMLATVRERGQWLQSLSFHCNTTEGGKSGFCTGHISRRCIFRIQGDFQWFERNILVPTTGEAVQTMRLYAHRARDETPDNAPRPIVIEYSEPLFRDRAQHKRLVHCLNRFPKANLSVIHGNPYFHASIVDFTDGSSYEIWVLSETRIILTPQFRATSSSIGRLCDHILSRFEEGEVKDFQQAVYAK